MLSICVTVKNRSRVRVDGRELQLFLKCIESIVEARRAARDLELVVADWQSDDWPLDEWLLEASQPIPVRLVTLSGRFSRGRGLNAAAQAAHGDCLFFIDSDAIVNNEVLRKGIETVQQGKAYFPILYSFNDPEHQTGRWLDCGFGHCMLSKQAFETIGGWPDYSSWGGEDDDFWVRASELLPVVRERVDGFYHQWHPDDIDFKNQYGEETDEIRTVRARAEQAELERLVQERLQKTLRRGASYILVDEDRTDIKDGVECPSIPFLENNGQYWGPPTDDRQAIRELERLHQQGAEYVVFPWVSSWWLDHYAAFADYLEKNSRCLAKDDLLTVYDLHCPRAGSGQIAQ